MQPFMQIQPKTHCQRPENTFKNIMRSSVPSFSSRCGLKYTATCQISNKPCEAHLIQIAGLKHDDLFT
eukprot:c4587_g1_i1 orf=25-228(-)